MDSGTFLLLLFAVAAGAWFMARFIPSQRSSYSRISSQETADADGQARTVATFSVVSQDEDDEDDAWRGRFNLDGTLMINHNFDINGNAYGSTETDWNSFALDD